MAGLRVAPGYISHMIFARLAAIALASAFAPAATAQVVLSELTYQTAPYPEAHASTVIELSSGAVAAAWFGGTKEQNPDVEIWFARRGAQGWEAARSVATGITAGMKRQPTWNPVLFQDGAGPLQLFYKVGPSPEEWWGMVITSSDDGRTWSKPRRLPDGILGPIKNKPVTLPDGSWLSGSSSEGPKGWRMHFERSNDRGTTWSATPPVASPFAIDAIQPSILFHKDGALQAVARSRQGAIATSWSKDGGRTWSDVGAIDLPNPNSGTDAVTLADGRQLIIYNHAAHSRDRAGKGPRWPLNIALSDDGLSWRNVLTLESAPVPAGYAYPAMIQGRDGRVHITYTVNRKHIRYVVIDPAQLR